MFSRQDWRRLTVRYAVVVLAAAVVLALLARQAVANSFDPLNGASILAVVAPRKATVGSSYVIYGGVSTPVGSPEDGDGGASFRVHMRICPSSGPCIRTRSTPVPTSPPVELESPATMQGDEERSAPATTVKVQEYWDWFGSFTPITPGDYQGELLLLRAGASKGSETGAYRTVARSSWHLTVYGSE